MTLASSSDRRVLFGNFPLSLSLSQNTEHVLFNVRQKYNLDTAYAPPLLPFSSKPTHFLNKCSFHLCACRKHRTKSTHSNKNSWEKADTILILWLMNLKLPQEKLLATSKGKLGCVMTFCLPVCWYISSSRGIISFGITEARCWTLISALIEGEAFPR